MSVVLVATLTPRPDAREAVRAAILRAVPRVHAEPGCELYALLEDDIGRFLVLERWESDEALAAHLDADALRGLSAELSGRLAGPVEGHRLTPLPAGEPGKGAV